MADIEEAEGHHGAVREWLGRAARAPRDKAWVADGVISDRWAPVSPSGTLDAFVWRTPDERIAAPAEPAPRRQRLRRQRDRRARLRRRSARARDGAAAVRAPAARAGRANVPEPDGASSPALPLHVPAPATERAARLRLYHRCRRRWRRDDPARHGGAGAPGAAASGFTPMSEARPTSAADAPVASSGHPGHASRLGRHRRRRPCGRSGRRRACARRASRARSFFCPPRRTCPISARPCRRRFSRARWTSMACR